MSRSTPDPLNATGESMATGLDAPLLEVIDLVTTFGNDGASTRAVDHVSFTLAAGASLAIVGESGAGKSAVARSITGLLPRVGVTRSGQARLKGTDLLSLSDQDMREYLGPEIGVLFQDPMSYLNPVIRVGVQLTERMRPLLRRSKSEAAEAAEALLESVGVSDAARRMRQFPHELSGGIRQRVAIAIALACDPALLIADEPTTALDPTVQQQVVELLRSQQHARRMGLILITHDLRLAAEIADELIVMYAGQVVERGPASQVLEDPRMPYTRALLDAIPKLGQRGSLSAIPGEGPDLSGAIQGCRFSARCWAATDRCRESAPPLQEHDDGRSSRCWYPDEARRRPAALVQLPLTVVEHPRGNGGSVTGDESLLRVESLSVDYRVAGTRRRLQAVADVSFDVRRGETLAVVGESGCGKSTIAKAIMQVVKPSAGRISLGDTVLTELAGSRLRAERPRFQMVFQDPFSSLNPLRRITEIVAEPLAVWAKGDAAERREKAEQALRVVGLDPARVGDRQPHQLSGGQCQRVAIARAIVLEPDIIVCDEPVSALDVSVQAQVLNLLAKLKAELGLTMVFISHDLAVVSHVADRIMVMYLGRICEIGTAEEVFERPDHPYTAALLSLVRDDADLSADRAIGDVPSPTDIPTGCRFRTRCPHATALCAEVEPQLTPRSDGHLVACHFPLTADAMPR